MKKETKEIIKKLLIVLLCSLLISIIMQLANHFLFDNPVKYTVHKIILYAGIYSFFLLHVAFDIEKLYDFIINNRYKIAGILLIVLTLLQFTNSSNSYYSLVTFEKDKYSSVFGKHVSYLSDEYSVETPIAVSQSLNSYKYFNPFLRGTQTDVFTIVHAPVLNLLSIGKIYNIGYLFGSHIGLAFENNFKTIFLALATFELLEIITGKKKLYSLIGAFVLTTSIAVQINLSLIIACGEAALVLFDQYLININKKKKLLCALGIILLGINYTFTFYPAFLVPFGYLFLALAIWIFLKNKSNYKPRVIDLVILTVSIVIIVLFVITYFYKSADALNIIKDTVYPGNRIAVKVNGLPLLFTYLYNFLIPFMMFKDNFVTASIFGLFPIPLIIAIIYWIKGEVVEHKKFLIPLTIFSAFMLIFVTLGFPNIINKFTLMSFSIQERASSALALGSFYMLIYIMANIQKDYMNKVFKILLIELLLIIIAFWGLPQELSNNKLFFSLVPGVFCLFAYCFLNIDKREYKILFVFLFVLIAFPGLFFRPVTIGAHDLTDLDISVKIRELSKDDSLWIGADLPRGLSNLLVANGAKTVTSVATYPNKDMYIKLLGSEALDKDIAWNRYGQFETKLSDINDVRKETKSDDIINLYINYDGLKKLGIKYLLTYDDEETIRSKGIPAAKIYEKINENQSIVEDEIPKGIYIYEIK